MLISLTNFIENRPTKPYDSETKQHPYLSTAMSVPHLLICDWKSIYLRRAIGVRSVAIDAPYFVGLAGGSTVDWWFR